MLYTRLHQIVKRYIISIDNFKVYVKSFYDKK